MDDYEVLAEELSKLGEKWRDLEERFAEVERVNARLERTDDHEWQGRRLVGPACGTVAQVPELIPRKPRPWHELDLIVRQGVSSLGDECCDDRFLASLHAQ